MTEKDFQTEPRSWEWEVLKQMGAANKRWFITCIVLVLLLAGSNMAWLYVYQSYDYTSTETNVTVDSADGTGDAIYQSGWGNSINGKSQSDKKDNNPN